MGAGPMDQEDGYVRLTVDADGITGRHADEQATVIISACI